MLCTTVSIIFLGIACLTSAQEDEATLSFLPDLTVCGIQNAGRIVGDTQTKIDEHPWTALIIIDKPIVSMFYCGGVLISLRYVLTAAHCVSGSLFPPTWRVSRVRLGEWNISRTVDCNGEDCSPPPLDVSVEEVITHDNFDPIKGDYLNNIALLRLSRLVPFNDFVKPICLPTSTELRGSTFETYDVEVAGWGTSETGTKSDVKLKARIPVEKLRRCTNTYYKVNRIVTDSHLCAGGSPGQDTCKVDSGGALMGTVPGSQNWMALGVLSYGPSSCGSLDWPGVYTRVSAYIDWIVSKLRS